MTSEKQLIANLKNAQVSTGPLTVSGKKTVSVNAIKHGIFTKELILSSAIGNESESEYQEILTNLIDCLSPCDQMESLLVEKIAVDFWRLRRTIRFETGSIVEGIKDAMDKFYSYGRQDNEKIDKEIQDLLEAISWNSSYLECLSRYEVTFDQPEWEGKEIESDIIEDFYLIVKTFSDLTEDERERLYSAGGLSFEELVALLEKNGYTGVKEISNKLFEIYTEQNQRLEEDIQRLAKQKVMNESSNKLFYMLGMVPTSNNTDKVLKYERSLQKSIFQNLVMLKKMQGIF